jgi:NADH:ubiquinone reductase (non-electrogenic)
LTYLSAIGGVAYMVYGVYDLRHPDDQFEPDPTKQNLVILGAATQSGSTAYS